MHEKDCKTCNLAHLVKHTEHHINHPDYLEGRCRIPLFARITTKGKKEYCADWEPIPEKKKKVKKTDA